MEFILKDGAKLPFRGSPQAAGVDICALKHGYVLAGRRQMIKTGVYLNQLPPDTYLRIAPRSKLANRCGIDVLAGVVDADYRGEICVILFNTNNDDNGIFQYEAGDAIAQLILENYNPTEPRDVTYEQAYSPTVRGESGIQDQDVRLSHIPTIDFDDDIPF